MILLALCLRSRKINSRAGRGIEKTEVKKPSTTWLAVHNNSWHYPAAAAPPSSLYAPVFFFLFLFILLLPDWLRVACALPTFQPTATQFSKGEPGGGYRPTPHRFAVFFSLSLSLFLFRSSFSPISSSSIFLSIHSLCVSLSPSVCAVTEEGDLSLLFLF